jgi:glyoxylase-like metal-dependent hydrolase (beta-lactamase superfamily II)
MFHPITLDAHNPNRMTGSGNHTYLLVGGDRSALLIDAGIGDARHLEALAQALVARGARLRDVIVTHGHPDHASGAAAIARAHPQARFFKHPWPGVDDSYGVQWQPIRDGDEFSLGDASLTALLTPGHSPDHVVFWHRQSRTVFSGDLVVQGSSVMIHASKGGDLIAYLRSLERLLELGPGRLLPAHGPDVDDPRSLLRGYLEHRRAREAQVVAALREGRDEVSSIVESIYDGLSPELVGAASETVLAHLEKLRREGQALERAGRWAVSDEA